MIQSLISLIRSYTDALFASISKTAADDRRIVYPWGVFARGYVIASADDEERLKNAYAVYLAIVTIVMGIGFAWPGYLGMLVAGVLILVGYVIALRRLTATMERSDERMSLADAYRAQAIRHGSSRLWSWMVIGIFLVCLGTATIVYSPVDPLMLAVLIVIGVCMIAFAGWLFLLRRGAAPPATAFRPATKSVVAEEIAFYFTGDVGPLRAWLITILGLLFASVGIFVFAVIPEERSGAAGMIVVSGLIAALGIAMIVLRRRRLQGH